MSKDNLWFRIFLLFGISFLVRFVVGIIFYGGIDLNAFMDLTKATFQNSLYKHMFYLFNYFPLSAFYWWFSGWLFVKTNLPLALCFKMVPIMFDSLIAVLIFEILHKKNKKYALFSGLLYALSPIAIIVDCIQVQWDALFMFFLLLSFYVRDFFIDSIKKNIIVGFLFTISVLMKPVSLIFLPLIFHAPDACVKQEFKQNGRSVLTMFIIFCFLLGIIFAGSFAVIKLHKMAIRTFANWLVQHYFFCGAIGIAILLCFIAFIFYVVRYLTEVSSKTHFFFFQQCAIICGGLIPFVVALFGFSYFLNFNLIQLCDNILRYFNQGVQFIGLPFAYPFSQVHWLGVIIHNRVWLLFFIIIIAFYYYQSRINAFLAMMLILVLIISFCGITPPYYVWLLPFLLVEGFFEFAIAYNFIVSVFYLFFYINPYSCFWFNLNALSYAMLKEFQYFSPPAYFTSQSLSLVIRLLSNYLIPIGCMVFIVYLLFTIRKQQKNCFSDNKVGEFFVMKNKYIIFTFVLNLLIVGLMAVTPNGFLAGHFVDVKIKKMSAYNITHLNGSYCWAFGHNHFFNAVIILLLLIMIFMIVAFRIAKKYEKNKIN